jgi:hypothetical protein
VLQHPFAGCKLKLVGCETKEAFRKKLAADNDVSPHGKNSDERENSTDEVDPFCVSGL